MQYELPPPFYLEELIANQTKVAKARGELRWAWIAGGFWIGLSMLALLGALLVETKNPALTFAYGAGNVGFLLGFCLRWRSPRRWLDDALRSRAFRPIGPALAKRFGPIVAEVRKKLAIQRDVAIWAEVSGEVAGRRSVAAYVIRHEGKAVVVLGRTLLAVFTRDLKIARGVLAHELAHVAHQDDELFHESWHVLRHLMRAAKVGTATSFAGVIIIGIVATILERQPLNLVIVVIAAGTHSFVNDWWIGKRLRKAAARLCEANREAERLADLGAAAAVGVDDVSHAITCLCGDGASTVEQDEAKDLHPSREQRLAYLALLNERDLLRP